MSERLHRHFYLLDQTLYARVLVQSLCNSVLFALYFVLVGFGFSFGFWERTQMWKGFNRHVCLSYHTLFARVIGQNLCKSTVFALIWFWFGLVWFGFSLGCWEMTKMSQGFHRHLYLSDQTLFVKVIGQIIHKSMDFAWYLVMVWFGLVWF